MAEVKQIYRVELVVNEEDGDQHIDEIDVERMLTGQADWHERIVNVRAEKVEEAPTENEPHYIGPVP